jgi:hypothetical protein
MFDVQVWPSLRWLLAFRCPYVVGIPIEHLKHDQYGSINHPRP